MVRIDGGKVRRLRESKGLTQLYLSTVVGVTTDTISRWENRRYQSIKLENADKLAQALEIKLEDILDQEQYETVRLSSKKESKKEKTSIQTERIKLLAILSGIILVILTGILTYSLLTEHPQGSITAERILPPHAPPGEAFPVLIRVHSTGQKPVSLIIKESIPSGSNTLDGIPVITSIDRKDNSLKWISRTDQNQSFYAYMCRITANVPQGEKLSFNGSVTVKEGISDHYDIRGTTSITVAPFHWADTNRDNMIDDEEILAVYDLYSDIKELNFDRDLIDSIWAGKGYAWDEGKKQYVVQN